MKKLLIAVSIVLLLAGCSRQPVPRQMVVLVDMSASIEPHAELECLDAVTKLISMLDRGDAVSIIPITGDADVQSTGHVLRFQKPVTRTAYDADLLGFSKHIQQSLQEFRAEAIKHPTSKTDIFGAIRMAGEEFTSTPNRKRILIVFSDFIEDDGNVNFRSDRRLSSVQLADKYATAETKEATTGRLQTKVNLALLRSKELRSLGKERREAIKEFWLRYFKLRGAEPTYTTDGVGLLSIGF